VFREKHASSTRDEGVTFVEDVSVPERVDGRGILPLTADPTRSPDKCREKSVQGGGCCQESTELVHNEFIELRTRNPKPGCSKSRGEPGGIERVFGGGRFSRIQIPSRGEGGQGGTGSLN